MVDLVLGLRVQATSGVSDVVVLGQKRNEAERTASPLSCRFCPLAYRRRIAVQGVVVAGPPSLVEVLALSEGGLLDIDFWVPPRAPL